MNLREPVFQIKSKDYSITWEGVAKTIFFNKDFGQALDADMILLPI
jgi:hypothetical protein